MRSLVALATMAACSAPAPARVAKPVAPPEVAAPTSAVSPAAAPIPTVHTKRDAIEAPHAGAIQSIALSPDGSVALSTDELGGARLWLALDGSQEPRIVELPASRAIAIGKRGDWFSAVVIDEVGGLYLAKIDTSGRTLSHTTLAADPAYTGMAMTTVGLLAWRADQTLVLLDADGAATQQIATSQGQRVVDIAVAGSRAVVVIERAGLPRRARWLKLEPKLEWGAWIDLDTDFGGMTDVALSPKATRLALMVSGKNAAQKMPLVFDVAKKKPIATGTPVNVTAEIGFVDDDIVAIGGFDGISWIDLRVAKPAQSVFEPMGTPGTRQRAALGTGGGHAVSAINGDLVIATPAGLQFLGYEMVAPRMAEVGPNGELIVATTDTLMWLDKDLRVTRSLPAATANVAGIIEMRWLGDNDWLVESGASGRIELSLFDATKGVKTSVLRSALRETQVLNYEPSTKLATLSFGQTSEVVRFDRAGHKLDRIASVAKPSPYEQVLLVPVAPKLARGTQLIQISMRDKSTIKWLRDARALDKPSASVVVDGPFAAADAAGNVYMWRPNTGGQLELVVYADGKQIRTLPNTGPVSLWPEPAGARVAQASQTAITLLDGAGKAVWTQPLATTQEALWTSDGAIAITSAGGIARLDPATGAITSARCGWKFGLAPKLHPLPPRIEPLCAQIRR